MTYCIVKKIPITIGNQILWNSVIVKDNISEELIADARRYKVYKDFIGNGQGPSKKDYNTTEEFKIAKRNYQNRLGSTIKAKEELEKIIPLDLLDFLSEDGKQGWDNKEKVLYLVPMTRLKDL